MIKPYKTIKIVRGTNQHVIQAISDNFKLYIIYLIAYKYDINIFNLVLLSTLIMYDTNLFISGMLLMYKAQFLNVSERKEQVTKNKFSCDMKI